MRCSNGPYDGSVRKFPCSPSSGLWYWGGRFAATLYGSIQELLIINDTMFGCGQPFLAGLAVCLSFRTREGWDAFDGECFFRSRASVHGPGKKDAS